jgi:hypothetical protein
MAQQVVSVEEKKIGVRRDSIVLQCKNTFLKPGTQKKGNTMPSSDVSFIGSRQNNFSQFVNYYRRI